MVETEGVLPFKEVKIIQKNENGAEIKGSINYPGVKTANMTASGGTDTMVMQWPYYINLLNGQIYAGNVDDGDTVEAWCEVGQVGVLGAAAAINDTVLAVNSTVIDNVANGQYIKLPQGADLYRIVAIDKVNSQITIEGPGLVAAASAMDSVEYFPYFIGSPTVPVELSAGMDSVQWGADTFDGSLLPPNKPLKIKYVNNGLAAKVIRGHLAILT